MTCSADLVAFLVARYAEDWAVARDHELAAGLAGSRATRDIDAKREIVVEHPACADDPHHCARCLNWRYAVPAPWPCTTLRLLATTYSDHPDYNPEWKL